jgi:hypothetical protein
MMKKTLTLAALFGAQLAAAATGQLTFTPPTTRVDGSALSASEIAGYDVQCSRWTATGAPASTTCTQFAGITLPAGATGGTLAGTVPATGGQACFQVRTRDTAGQVSAWSAEGCKTFGAVAPNPPTNVVVAVVIGINMAPVVSVTATGQRGTTMLGFVPIGLECQGAPTFTYRGKQWRKVTTLPVKWWASAPTQSAAVPCSG